MTGPVFQSVIPYRLRGLGSALAAIYIFFIGASGGALVAAFLTDEFSGPRVAMVVVAVPASLIGGLLIVRKKCLARFARTSRS